MFSIISAIGKNNEIGKKGGLVFHLKDDMKFFRETTTGHKVIMGYNTWRSLPSKLKNRKNVVISYEKVEDADETVLNLEQFVRENEDTEEEIFVIGGGTVYRKLLPHSKNLYLTEIDGEDKEADTFFPDFDKKKYTKKILKKGTENGLKYVISKYSKK